MVSKSNVDVQEPTLSASGADRVLRWVLIAILALVVAWTLAVSLTRYYRLPITFDIAYSDTGIFAEEGRTVVNGVLYRDLWSTKPPGMFILMSVFIRLMGNTVAAIAASTVFMYAFFAVAITALAYAVSRSWAGALIGGVFALLFSARITYPETTIPMAACGATAMTLALLGRGRPVWMVLAGLLFAFGVLTKQPLVFELPILLAFAALRAPGSRWRKLRAVVWVCVGGGIAAVAFLGWMLSNDTLHSFIFHVYSSAQQYVFRSDGDWHFSEEGLELFQDYFLGATVPLMATYFLLAVGAAVVLLRQRRNALLWIMLAWVALSFFSASLPRGLRPEYFRQMVPPLVALIALAVPAVQRMSLSRQVVASAVVLAAALWFGGKQVGLPSLRASPPASIAVDTPILTYIETHTQPDDCLWPWGGLLRFSYLTERKSCVSAAYDGYLMDRSAFPVVPFRVEFMQNLFDRPPTLHLLQSGWGYFKEEQNFADRYLGPIVETSGTISIFSVDMSKMHRTSANFAGEIGLIAYDLPPKASYCPGDALPMALTWQRLSTPTHQYQSFVQLVNADETAQIAGHDDVPAVRRPTNTWVDDGEVVLGPTFDLDLPTDAAPGTYRLIAGLYDVETQAHLSTLGADGQANGSYARLTDIVVGANCPAA